MSLTGGLSAGLVAGLSGRAMAGVSAFSPANDPDLWGWWVADDYTAAAGSWVGRGTAPKTINVTRTGSRPDPGGLPLAVFSGSGVARCLAALAQPYTIVLGGRTPNVADGGGAVIFGDQSDGARNMCRSQGGAWNVKLADFILGVGDLAVGNLTQNAPWLITAVVNGASSSTRLNGANVASGVLASAYTPDGLRLNDDEYASVAVDMGYAWIAVVERAMSLADIQLYEELAAAASGVTLP